MHELIGAHLLCLSVASKIASQLNKGTYQRKLPPLNPLIHDATGLCFVSCSLG
jgi:hypothetical protein